MKVLAIGDTCADVIVCAKKPRLEGETSAEIELAAGGSACNFAIAAAGLGMDVSLRSKVGEDVFGDFISTKLDKYGVDNIVERCKLKTSISAILVRGDGKKSILSSKAASADLSTKDLLTDDFGVIYVGGYYHLPKLRGKLAPFLKKAKNEGRVVAIDLVCDREGQWEGRELLPFVDILFGNECEISRLMGAPLRQAVKNITKLNPSILVVVKRGGRGAEAYNAKEKFSERPPATRAVDETGAGDAFNAGFLYAHLKGCKISDCLRAGNFMGSRVVQCIGAQAGLPEKSEVDGLLSSGRRQKKVLRSR